MDARLHSAANIVTVGQRLLSRTRFLFEVVGFFSDEYTELSIQTGTVPRFTGVVCESLFMRNSLMAKHAYRVCPPNYEQRRGRLSGGKEI